MVGLTARSDATLAVPVLAAPSVAVTGDAAAMPRGSSSTTCMPLTARATGCSKKRSVAEGAGGPMSMRTPSTTSPLAIVRTRPSDKRVSS